MYVNAIFSCDKVTLCNLVNDRITTTCEKVSLTIGLKLSMHNDEIIFQQKSK